MGTRLLLFPVLFVAGIASQRVSADPCGTVPPAYPGQQVALTRKGLQQTADSNYESGKRWHGWPADAPAPAIAPFDKATAKKHQVAWAKYLGVSVEKEITIGKDKDSMSVRMTMVLIPPGEFVMGSTSKEQEHIQKKQPQNPRIPSEGPRHRVRITRPFLLGKFEVTQTQWQALLGENPSQGKEDSSLPITRVNWNNVQTWLVKLQQRRRPNGIQVNLPTEAQWEYACRAGTTTIHYHGDSETLLHEYAWFRGNSGGRRHSVGQLKPNSFGLYDMLGNVHEWCSDWYSRNYYANAPTDDPRGPTTGSARVYRGGSWSWSLPYTRSAARNQHKPTSSGHSLGFRLAASIEAFEPPDKRSDATQAPSGKAWSAKGDRNKADFKEAKRLDPSIELDDE